jgi:hypothetical protein
VEIRVGARIQPMGFALAVKNPTSQEASKTPKQAQKYPQLEGGGPVGV